MPFEHVRRACGPSPSNAIACRRRAGGWRSRRCRPGAGRRPTASSGRGGGRHLSQQTTRNFGSIVQKHRVQSPPGSPAAGASGTRAADQPTRARWLIILVLFLRHDDQLRRPGDAVDRRHRPVARSRLDSGHPRLPALGLLLELRRAADSRRLAARPARLAAGLPVEPARAGRCSRSPRPWSAATRRAAAPRSPRSSGSGSGSAPPKRLRSRPTAASSRSGFRPPSAVSPRPSSTPPSIFPRSCSIRSWARSTHAFGWPWVFVLMGAVGLVFGLAWNRLVYEPADHPRANAAEVEHIRRGGGLVDLDRADGRRDATSPAWCPRAAAATDAAGHLPRPVLHQRPDLVLPHLVPDLPGAGARHVHPAGRLRRRRCPALCGFLGGILGGWISDGLLRSGRSLSAGPQDRRSSPACCFRRSSSRATTCDTQWAVIVAHEPGLLRQGRRRARLGGDGRRRAEGSDRPRRRLVQHLRQPRRHRHADRDRLHPQVDRIVRGRAASTSAIHALLAVVAFLVIVGDIRRIELSPAVPSATR